MEIVKKAVNSIYFNLLLYHLNIIYIVLEALCIKTLKNGFSLIAVAPVVSLSLGNSPRPVRANDLFAIGDNYLS